MCEFTCIRRARMKSGQADYMSQQYSISAPTLACETQRWGLDINLLPSCMRRTQILPAWALQTDVALGPNPGINTHWEKYSTNSSLKHSWSSSRVVHPVCFSHRHSAKESVREVGVIKLSKIRNRRGKRRDWHLGHKKPDR